MFCRYVRSAMHWIHLVSDPAAAKEALSLDDDARFEKEANLRPKVNVRAIAVVDAAAPEYSCHRYFPPTLPTTVKALQQLLSTFLSEEMPREIFVAAVSLANYSTRSFLHHFFFDARERMRRLYQEEDWVIERELSAAAAAATSSFPSTVAARLSSGRLNRGRVAKAEVRRARKSELTNKGDVADRTERTLASTGLPRKVEAALLGILEDLSPLSEFIQRDEVAATTFSSTKKPAKTKKEREEAACEDWGEIDTTFAGKESGGWKALRKESGSLSLLSSLFCDLFTCVADSLHTLAFTAEGDECEVRNWSEIDAVNCSFYQSFVISY